MSNSGLSTKLVLKPQDVILNFDAGARLFSQGDPGGGLMFIEAGTVEIFITKNDQDITLAQMEAGEIIGVMTFLTHDARMASARAITPTRVKKITSTQVQKLIATFPKWLNIVLKEFVGRIQEMNRRYSETLIELKKSRETQITPLFIGTQVASAMAVLATHLKKDIAGTPGVGFDEMCGVLQQTLNQPREVIESILGAFSECNLLPIFVEPDHKRKIIPVASIGRAAGFVAFVRDSGQGQTKKILRAGMTQRELFLLRGLVKYAEAAKKSMDKNIDISAVDLTANLSAIGGVAFEFELLQRAAKLNLVTTSGASSDGHVSFVPATLSVTVAHLMTCRRLNGEEEADVMTPPTPQGGDTEEKIAS